jgi:hypothetical protein
MACALMVGLIGSKNLLKRALSVTGAQLILRAKQKEIVEAILIVSSLLNAICIDNLASVSK